MSSPFQFPDDPKELATLLANADQITSDIKGIYSGDSEEMMGLLRCMMRLQTNQRLNGSDYRRLTHALHVFLIGFGMSVLENKMEGDDETE